MHVKIIENTRFSEAFMPKIHKNCDDGMSARNDRSVSSSGQIGKRICLPRIWKGEQHLCLPKHIGEAVKAFVKNVTGRFSYISPALFSERAGFLYYECRIG